MFIPAAFKVTDEDALYGVIEANGFATLVSVDGSVPTATLAPFIVTHDDGRRRVWGHFARANPQAQTLRGEAEVLVIFRGPDAYVSPSWYTNAPNVPTWNFVVVHAYGIPRVLPREDPRVRWVLERTVERYESELESPWALAGPEEYLAGLAKGVVAFELEVTRLEGQFKLSQNHPRENRLGVIAQLERGGDAARAVAHAMKTHEKEDA